MTRKHWQVVRVTGVGLGELWFDVEHKRLTQNQAEDEARRADDLIAIPMSYDPTDEESREILGGGKVVDDYERGLKPSQR